jgi:hypothetical protein
LGRNFIPDEAILSKVNPFGVARVR